VEILSLLCREYVNKENSLLLENPLEFWKPFTISRYDNRTSEYLSEEIKRIITKFYPKLVNRLPFLFDGSGLERWN
jgi:predicted metalloendopeptidase